MAEASRHDELVVELAAVEIYVAGYIEHDMTRARRWINQAQGFLDRIGGHDLLRAWVLEQHRRRARRQRGPRGRREAVLPGAAHQGARARQGSPGRRVHAVQPRRHAARARAPEGGAGRHQPGHRNPGADAGRQPPAAGRPAGEPRGDPEPARSIQRGAARRGARDRDPGASRPARTPRASTRWDCSARRSSASARRRRRSTPFERAIKLADKATLEDELPRLRFALARALWDSGRDRRQARALAAKRGGTAGGRQGGRGRRDVAAGGGDLAGGTPGVRKGRSHSGERSNLDQVPVQVRVQVQVRSVLALHTSRQKKRRLRVEPPSGKDCRWATDARR